MQSNHNAFHSVPTKLKKKLIAMYVRWNWYILKVCSIVLTTRNTISSFQTFNCKENIQRLIDGMCAYVNSFNDKLS